VRQIPQRAVDALRIADVWIASGPPLPDERSPRTVTFTLKLRRSTRRALTVRG
jgi:hypothetical protein